MRHTVEGFEGVIAWQKARILTRSVYSMTARGAFAADRGLANQIQRSAVSIMANIAEGYERGRPREYLQFLRIAKASCAEVRSHLYVALDSEYIDDAIFTRLQDEAREAARTISGLHSAVYRSLTEV